METTQDYTGMQIEYSVARDPLGDAEDRVAEYAEFLQAHLEKEYPGSDISVDVVDYRTSQNGTRVTLPSGADSYGGSFHEMEEVQEAEKQAEWVEAETEKAWSAWLESLN